jgi:hypothetical protein
MLKSKRRMRVEIVQSISGVLKLGRYLRNRAGFGVYFPGKAT